MRRAVLALYFLVLGLDSSAERWLYPVQSMWDFTRVQVICTTQEPVLVPGVVERAETAAQERRRGGSASLSGRHQHARPARCAPRESLKNMLEIVHDGN